MSTTGYSTANFDMWPALSKGILVLLMFVGGCAGSTAGGMKVTRIVTYMKSMVRNIRNMIHPRKVETIYLDGKPLSDEAINNVSGYFIVYAFIFIVCTLLISVDGHDLLTNITASLSCISNVGPGLGLVGPYGSFAVYSNFSKLILTLEMIIGRLEFYPILLLFSPRTWKKSL